MTIYFLYFKALNNILRANSPMKLSRIRAHKSATMLRRMSEFPRECERQSDMLLVRRLLTKIFSQSLKKVKSYGYLHFNIQRA